jgi:hypothetical protein
MRSAAVALFAGLATASYLPPAPVYEQPEPVYSEAPSAPAPSAPAVVSSAEAVLSSAPAYPETEFSTLVYTVTSCAPEVTNCPAASTVVSSSVVPLTTSTIYATTVKTIHECAETVTDCPYESKTQVVVTETIAISTTVCPVSEATPAPSHSAPGGYPVPSHSAPGGYPVPSHSAPAPSHSAPAGYPVPSAPAPSSTAGGNKPVYSAPVPAPSHPAEEECVPSKSTTVKTILHTTVLTSYETATIDVPCPSATAPSVVVPPPHVPTGGNATVPAVPTYTAPVSGAAGLSGSVLIAAVAGFAAYILV